MASRSLGSLTLDLVLKLAGFEQGMDRAARITDKRLKEMGDKAEKVGRAIGTSLKVAAAGAVVAIGAISLAIGDAIQNADELDELSQRLGISTERLSSLGYAAKLSGTDLDGLTNGLTRFSKNLASAADPNSRQGKLFATLGIEIKDAEGNLKSFEELLPQVADRFKTLDNETTETALAMELFGKSGADLLEFLNRGSDGISELEDRFRQLGGEISGETAAAAAQFNDRLDDLKTVANGIATDMAAKLLPALNDALDRLIELANNGKLAENAVSILSTAFSVGVGALELYNEAVDRVGIAFQGLAGTASGLSDLLIGVTTGNIDKVTAGYARMAEAASTANREQEALTAQQRKAAGLFDNVRGGSRTVAARSDSSLQNRLNGFLGSGGGKSSSAKGGKSDEEKELDKINQSYQRLMETAKERIALFGVEGEAAKIAYDIQNGSLKGLEKTKADELIAIYKELDATKDLDEARRAADDAVNREVEAYEKRMEGNEEYIDALKFEVGIMGLSNQEQEKAIALSYLSKDATDDQKQSVIELTEARLKAADQAKALAAVEGELSDAFFDVLTGSKSAKDAIEDFFDNLQKQILRAISDNWAKQIAGLFTGGGQSGASSGGGGWMQQIGSLLGSLWGGGRANGGWTGSRSIHEVNERGFEMATVGGRDYMLTGNQPVKITPHNRLNMGGTQMVTNNLTVAGRIDRRTESQIARQIGMQVRAAGRNN